MIDAEQGQGNSSSNEPPPPLNRAELKRFQELMTKGILEGGAFTLLEQPALKEAAQMLRPNASLPTRQTAASSILPSSYSEKKEEMYRTIRDQGGIYTFQFDGTKVNDNYPYMHYSLSSPFPCFLLEAKN